MAIQALGPNGKKVEPGAEGELVCTKPFHCQPLGFWPLEGMGAPQEVNEASARHRRLILVCGPACGVSGLSSAINVMVMIGRDCLALVIFSATPASYPVSLTGGTAETDQAGLNRPRDHVIISKSREQNGGGVVMLGRRDGVL